MNTPTEAHRGLVEKVFDLLSTTDMIGPSPADKAAQLIADSEARAIATQLEVVVILTRRWLNVEKERDQLRAEVERLRAGIEECLRTNAHLADGENCTLIDLKHCLRDSRVERAEAAETVALAQWNGALERAMKLRAELAAERARLDWVFRNCKVTADDYTTGHRDVYAIHDREDLGAAMKEGAK